MVNFNKTKINGAFKLFINISFILPGSILYFLSGLIKRKSNLAVYGCHLKVPAGNILAFYDHCVKADMDNIYKLIWIAKNKETLLFLKEKNYNCHYKYSLKGVYYCLIAKYYFYSCYVSDINYYTSKNAKLVNLWHGTPLKKIEFDINTGPYSIKYKYAWFFSKIQPWVFERPNILFVANKYEQKAFNTAFKMQGSFFYESYPPRLLSLTYRLPQSTGNIILIAPTFRDGSSVSYNQLINFDGLNKFAIENKLLFKVKAHPSDENLLSHIKGNYSNIEILKKETNIYEAITTARIVITDYSSIFFDCIYLNIPFILYWPDRDFYLKNCRDFYIDLEKMQQFKERLTYDQNDLVKRINTILLEEKVFFEIETLTPFPFKDEYPLDIFQYK